MNQEEYLKFASDNFTKIERLIKNYHPYYNRVHNHVITAVGAEQVCQLERERIQKKNKEPDLYEAIENKDCKEICRIANAVWFGMPESMESRREPGFNALCDLCSELEVEWDEDEED